MRKSRKIDVTIMKFGVGSLLGDEAVFLNKEAGHTLICVSEEGIVSILDKTVFIT